jgi:hypothetical protein
VELVADGLLIDHLEGERHCTSPGRVLRAQASRSFRANGPSPGPLGAAGWMAQPWAVDTLAPMPQLEAHVGP